MADLFQCVVYIVEDGPNGTHYLAIKNDEHLPNKYEHRLMRLKFRPRGKMLVRFVDMSGKSEKGAERLVKKIVEELQECGIAPDFKEANHEDFFGFDRDRYISRNEFAKVGSVLVELDEHLDDFLDGIESGGDEDDEFEDEDDLEEDDGADDSEDGEEDEDREDEDAEDDEEEDDDDWDDEPVTLSEYRVLEAHARLVSAKLTHVIHLVSANVEDLDDTEDDGEELVERKDFGKLSRQIAKMAGRFEKLVNALMAEEQEE